MARRAGKFDKFKTVCTRQEIGKCFAIVRKWGRFTVDDGALHCNACYENDGQFKIN